MTIDWTQAPRWARYAAMDADGIWFWYAERPDPRHTHVTPAGTPTLAASNPSTRAPSTGPKP